MARQMTLQTRRTADRPACVAEATSARRRPGPQQPSWWEGPGMLQTTSTERRAAGGDRPRSDGSVKMRPAAMGMRVKHRWNVSHNYLAGITADSWCRLLRENHFAVDPVYWHRAAFITLASLMNSLARRKERRL